MMRCSNGYCCKLISTNRYHVRFQDRVFCREACRKEWQEENSKLSYAALAFKPEFSYPPCGDECDCESCQPQVNLPLPEPSTS